MAYVQCLSCIIQDSGPDGHKLEEVRAYMHKFTQRRAKTKDEPGYGEFRRILSRSWCRSHALARTRVEWRKHAHGDRRPGHPGGLVHGTARRRLCPRRLLYLRKRQRFGLLGVLDSHEFILAEALSTVFGRSRRTASS
ncbi:hypothetical protein V8E53_004496 [Lactarius tabidus]